MIHNNKVIILLRNHFTRILSVKRNCLSQRGILLHLEDHLNKEVKEDKSGDIYQRLGKRRKKISKQPIGSNAVVLYLSMRVLIKNLLRG